MTDKTSAFCDLFKVKSISDQEKRREVLLTEQKRRRNELLDEARGLNNIQNTKQSYCKKYRNRLMLSEWLVNVPSDFDVSWFLKICPTGCRNLVVACQNITKSFSKWGRFECEFKSFLPAGGSNLQETYWKRTILDCVFNEKTKSFYVLDVLMWADYDLTEYDAEFRFFWLQSKMSEIPELSSNIPNVNPHGFNYVPHMECDYIEMKNRLETYPLHEDNTPSVDGLLFYHKEASYTAGITPLVGWLKSFMVPEILNIQVAEEYLKSKPKKYINLVEHIRYRNEIRSKKLNPEMDTS